jgi:hypothetical protein
VAPLLFLFVKSQEATIDWMSFRDNPFLILEYAQSFWVWLRGTFLGNLIEIRDFHMWSNTSWRGVGVFFAPWLLLSLYSSWKKRDPVWPVVTLLLVAAMAAASFPFVRHLAIGPFAGFRWTWKLGFFLGPLALVSLLRLGQPGGPLRLLVNLGLAVALVLSVAVTTRGLSFNLLPSLRNAQPAGILTIVDETRDMMAHTGIEPGDRLALIGVIPIFAEKVPLPVIGLIGDAPLLAGLESAHLYEPLESATAATSHFNLSTPWRICIPVARYRAERHGIEEDLRLIGVGWLVSTHRGALGGPEGGVNVHRDRLGQATYVKRIGPVPLDFPWGVGDAGPVALTVGDDGSVETVDAMESPPEVAIGRRIDWHRLEDGRWRGVVNVLHIGWIAAVALSLLVTILGLRRLRSAS